ncbi:MAG TPA: enoyl-CoA hydratase-related protein [Thermoanaerobaculia bacterium]|nr:enoyl-CoA hydratase-related protein [Thermoanaerobaculia bacterium]
MAEGLLVRATAPAVLTLTLDRPAQGNGLTPALLREIQAALDQAEATTACRMVVLEGRDGVFSTGMDFEQAAAEDGGSDGGAAFLALLERLTRLPRVVVAKVDGRAAGGGVGLAVACDFVFATERSQFSLPEALWGLLPCCVLPFLIRRVGFQKAYAMTLATLPIGAAEAERIHLVDQRTEDPDEPIRRLAFRLSKIDPTTLGRAKRHFCSLWSLSPEVERAALAELAELMASPLVRRNIAAFVRERKLPWETSPPGDPTR